MSANARPRNTSFLLRIANPFTSFVLRSPLHGMISRRFMVITVAGRRTGAKYSTPVNYVRKGNELTVISRRGRTWWQNLRGGAPVTIRVEGLDHGGVGEVLELAGSELTEALREFYAGLGRELPAAAASSDRVVIRIKLDDDES